MTEVWSADPEVELKDSIQDTLDDLGALIEELAGGVTHKTSLSTEADLEILKEMLAKLENL